MMKKLVFFLMFLISVSAFACKCNVQSFGENFAQNDFVAEIEILRTYNFDSTNDDDERLYKADIKILKLYKGEAISSIFIKGEIGNIFGPGCEIDIKQGEKFLIYLNSEYHYQVSSCTAKKELNDPKIETERKALEFLLSRKIENTNSFYFSEKHFKKFKNLNPKNNFAIYQLKVNSKSKVESVSAIQNFGIPEDEKITEIIKNKFTMLKDFMTEIKNEEVTLVLFFDKETEDVISNFN